MQVAHRKLQFYRGGSIEFKRVYLTGTAVLKTASKGQDGKSVGLGFECTTKVEYLS
jgi:hypothetical protein